MRFARRRPAAQDPVGDMRRFAREALGDHDVVRADLEGLDGVISRAGDDRALVSVGDVFQSTVWLRDPGSTPVFDPPVSAEALDAAMRFLARAHWEPVE
jgi:hypothetical protein